MTDKQLDELLRRALSPTEQPPELPQAAPRFPHRKAWMGLAAACLCFVVSAGLFLSMEFGAKSGKAAPESAFDMMYATADSATGVEFRDESKKDSYDMVVEESVNSSVSGEATEPSAPSAKPEIPAAPEAPAESDTSAAPSTAPEKPTSSELDRAINVFLASLPDDYSDAVPLLTHVGSTERYVSMMVTTDTAIAYFTTDRNTGAVLSLTELLADESLKKISLTHPEEGKLAQEEVFYVSREGQVVIYRMQDAAASGA